VTPVAADAHRVLHVVLAPPEGPDRSIPVEFLPAPPSLAWRKVVFAQARREGEAQPSVSLSPRAPRQAYREPGADSLLGMLRTLRLMAGASPAQAAAVAAANPALSLADLDPGPRSFGDYTVMNRFAVRDATTDTLGICASVTNATARRLLFAPDGWVVRAGDRVYPVGTADFQGVLDPGESAEALLVLGRGPDGEPTRLLPDNAFRISAVVAASASPRPVSRMALEGFDPR
jgi:hypothetical protein